ncbi:MAG: hypothetical protein HY758_08490, partial [Nitrospirae bacterium]|nr:hypothetical protein [Nitrospirota bacterium]
AIRRPLDPVNLSDFEKHHVPVVAISRKCSLIPGDRCADVSVRIGEIEHVMEGEHYFSFIDFYINKIFTARMHLTYKKLHPAVSIYLNLDGGTLTVIAHCTTHGSWIKEEKLLLF